MEDQRTKERADIRSDYEALFSSDLGKRVLEHMVSQVHISRTPFVPGDPHKTAFNAGEAKFVLGVLDMVDGVDIRTIIAVSKEMNQRRNVSYG